MSARTVRVLLGSATAALVAAGGIAGHSAQVNQTAEAAQPGQRTAVKASHWFSQVEPAKDQVAFLRNGTTPARDGRYRIELAVTSKHHALSCFAEHRDEGGDLGDLEKIAAGDTSTVTIAESVPAGTDYNLICLGTSKKPGLIEGTVTETGL